MKGELYITSENKKIMVISGKLPQKEAVSIANEHFKTKTENLVIQRGKIIGKDEIKIGSKGELWAIWRKGKNDLQ